MFSFINIASLVVGLSCSILVLFYIRYELSYDKYHEDARNIYRVVREHQGETTWYNSSEHPLAASLKQDFPEVLMATRVKKNDEVGVVEYDSKCFYEKNIYFVDQDFLEIFTFPLLSGNKMTALKNPFSVLITQEMAVKYFGDKEPLGKIIQINEWYSDAKHNYEIKGVLKKIPANSHFMFDFLVSYNSLYSLKRGGRDSIETWTYFEPKTYIKLASTANPKNVEEKSPAFLKKYKGENASSEKIHLQPLIDIHLGGNLRFELENNSDMRIIYMFSAIAFFILIIACLNYINLSVARSTKRAMEVGMRKVVGANKKQLVRQFLTESVAFSILALLISFILVELIWMPFGSLIGRESMPNPFMNLDMVLVFIVIAIIVGFFSGSYPAFFVSSFQPIQIIKGNLKIGSKSSGIFRNSLVVIQFVVSIILIVCAFVIHKQLDYIKNRNLGFAKDQIISLYTLDGDLKKNPEPFKEELMRSPDILGVSASLDLPTTIRRTSSLVWDEEGEERKSELYYSFVDYDFFYVYDMEIIKGRNFSKNFPVDKKHSVVINETAAKNFGLENPIGKKLNGQGTEWTIIGMVKDFHFKSLHSKIEPAIFILLNENRQLDYFSIKVDPYNLPGTLDFIQEKWERFSPEFPFQYTFLDERIDRIYKSEQRLGKSFDIFTIIALMIASIGLIGLASFVTEQKKKEISVRKILGADFWSIIFMLAGEYMKCIGAAVLIAWPASYFFMKSWLKNFAYRTSIGVEIFILSGLAAGIITLMTVGYQSIKAAVTNPVDSLRYE
jgi:putative ABC transport system permease protein